MFKKVIAYPNGNVEYHYGDKIIINDKYGNPHIKIKTNTKETYGYTSGIVNLLNHSNKCGNN